MRGLSASECLYPSDWNLIASVTRLNRPQAARGGDEGAACFAEGKPSVDLGQHFRVPIHRNRLARDLPPRG